MLSRSYPYLLERWETDAQLTSGGNDVRNNSQFCVGVSTTYIIIRQMTSNEISPEGLSTTTRVPERLGSMGTGMSPIIKETTRVIDIIQSVVYRIKKNVG